MKISRHCCTTINLLVIFLIILISASLFQFGNAQTPTDSTSSSSSSSSSSDDDYALEGSKVSPSMALIIIVLVIGFVITGCVSIYIQQCSDNPPVGDPLSTNPTRVKTRSGLDQSVIDKFPTFVYSDVKDLKFGEGSLECAVCLNEFEEHETLRLLPKCNHVFHPDCIGAWLSGHTTCPVCRADLVPDPTQSSGLEEVVAQSGPSHEVEVITVEPELPKGRVPRSNSTGHSLARPGEGRDRFTLRLPDEVRKQLIVAQPKLKRTISLVALPRVSSSRRGYRSGGGGGRSGGEGSGSSRYGRFFGRSFKWATRNNGDGDGSTGSKRFFSTVVTPVEALPRLPV